MAGRKNDDNLMYKVYIHTQKKYKYAAVQISYIDNENGKRKYKIIHLGTLDSNLLFYPNLNFIRKPKEERRKYIFPKDWNLSMINKEDILERSNNEFEKETNQENNDELAINNLDSEPEAGNNKSFSVDIEEEYINNNQNNKNNANKEYSRITNNRLYGAFWLLEQIAYNIGLYDDLLKVFNRKPCLAKEILTLSIYPYIARRNYNRFSRWQEIYKTLVEYPLNASRITRISQDITDNDRMRFIKLRFDREPKKSNLDCDSTSISAWGKCLADIRWGYNKDNPQLKNTIETTIYSLSTHQPIYYRLFPGNVVDMSTIRTILSDMEYYNKKDVIFQSDRGYVSEENIANLVAADISFIVCAKTSNKHILKKLIDIKYDDYSTPKDMFYDKERKIFYKQAEIEEYPAELPKGTVINVKNLRANLFLNIVNRAERLTELRLKIDEEKNRLNEDIKKGFIPNNFSKYDALFEYHDLKAVFDVNKKVVGFNYTESQTIIEKCRSQLGYFCTLQYKVDNDPLEIYDRYKERDEHEKNFDILKNKLLYKTQRCNSEDGKNGKAFISFVGLIIISELTKYWKQKLKEDYPTTFSVLDEMQNIRFYEYADSSTNMTTFTKKQVKISRACGINPPIEATPKYLR